MSIIIPVYNVVKYLDKCIESVCAQTEKSIEIILVDDESNDGSIDVCRRWAEKDDRIVLIEQKNAGAGAARNTGLRAAKGEYLLFLDSDDFFEPDMVEEALKSIEEVNADFVVFGSDTYYMDKDEFIRNPWVLNKKHVPPYMPFTHRELTDNVFKVFVGWAWDKLYRTEFVKHMICTSRSSVLQMTCCLYSPHWFLPRRSL